MDKVKTNLQESLLIIHLKLLSGIHNETNSFLGHELINGVKLEGVNANDMRKAYEKLDTWKDLYTDINKRISFQTYGPIKTPTFSNIIEKR